MASMSEAVEEFTVQHWAEQELGALRMI